MGESKSGYDWIKLRSFFTTDDGSSSITRPDQPSIPQTQRSQSPTPSTSAFNGRSKSPILMTPRTIEGKPKKSNPHDKPHRSKVELLVKAKENAKQLEESGFVDYESPVPRKISDLRDNLEDKRYEPALLGDLKSNKSYSEGKAQNIEAFSSKSLRTLKKYSKDNGDVVSIESEHLSKNQENGTNEKDHGSTETNRRKRISRKKRSQNSSSDKERPEGPKEGPTPLKRRRNGTRKGLRAPTRLEVLRNLRFVILGSNKVHRLCTEKSCKCRSHICK